ncbi:MAG: FAD-binding oxidoreductase [Candidatus Aminicenantes bacterium]|nr:FAD-binding oxidoreductase [Candidatus Aminicenantes bacterium]
MNRSNYEVIIIGAGSIGTPTAFSLAREGFKVLVIDRNASPGQSSNKRAIGGLRATHSDPAKIRLCRRSLEIFSTWKETYGDEIEWYKGGYCFVAYGEKEEKTLKEILPLQKKYGLKIDWLEAEDLRKLIPDLNPRGLRGGTFSPEDGHASPLLAIEAFYRQAKKLGAEFRFREKVIAFSIEGGKIKGVITDKGAYGAEVVINAAGAWAAETGHLAGLDLPVMPDSHEAAVTEPVKRFFDPMVVDIRPMEGSANYYFYQHATGQIIFCITPNPNIWGFDERETSSFLPMVAKRMIELMPRLKNIRIRRTWRGLYPMTPDGFPIIGWVKEVDGLLLAIGMCGQGFMLGPGVAELLTRIIAGKTTPEDEEILAYLSPYRQFTKEEKLK